MLTVITRWVDAHRQTAHRLCNTWETLDVDEEEVLNLDEGEIVSNKLNKKLTMKLYAKVCEDDDREVFFGLWHRDDVVKNASSTQITWIKLLQGDNTEEKLGRLLGKSLVSCACGTWAIRDGKCEDCYMFHLEKEDNCSICLENGGWWQKLECGHSFHRHCILRTALEAPVQVQGKLAVKCPLCRHATKEEDWKTE